MQGGREDQLGVPLWFYRVALPLMWVVALALASYAASELKQDMVLMKQTLIDVQLKLARLETKLEYVLPRISTGGGGI